MGAPRFVLDRFWPSNLFLGGIPGAWYDPTDLSTMFQDNTGLTPVTAVEQPVGLIFDKSQGTPAARYNRLTFSEDFGNAAWAKANITVSSNSTTAPDGTLTADTYTVTATLSAISYQDAVVSGSTITYSIYAKQNSGATDANTFAVYNLTTATILSIFTVNYATGAISHVVGSGATATAAGNGWWRLSVTHSSGVSAGNSVRVYPCFIGNSETAGESAFIWGAQLEAGSTATTYQRITSGTGGEWTPGNHASQSNAASRPTYRARYNLLTQSEDFSQAVWVKTGTGTGSAPAVTTNAATAPDGTLTADSIVFNRGAGNAVGDQSSIAQAPTVSNATYTQTVWLKAATPADVGKQLGLRNVAAASFVTVTLTADWVRYTRTETGAIANWEITNRGTITTNNTVTALVWGAQLLTAADVTATGNAYQRIAAATVYDTAAVFRPYLAFDGLDDSLSTSAINFTSTDKMTVFAGVTKSSDAASGTVVELSADVATNNGTFYMRAPNSATPDFLFLSKGTTFRFVQATPFASPSTAVLTGVGDIAAPVVVFRRNGAQVGTNALSQGTGTYGTYPLFIGRQNNAIYPLNGRLFSLIVRGAASSVTEIADTELWVNARTGAY